MRNERRELRNHVLLSLLNFQGLFLPSFQGLPLYKAPVWRGAARRVMAGGPFLRPGERWEERPRALPKCRRGKWETLLSNPAFQCGPNCGVWGGLKAGSHALPVE